MIRRLQPALVALASLAVVAGCTGGGASPSPSAPAATTSPSTPASVAPTATPAPSSNLKIGVVTDIGTLDDKNFNEYSYKGAVAGAADIGAATPPSIVPKDQSEYATDIQSFVSQGYNIIVTVGFNLAGPTTTAAHDNPNIWFIGVDQSPICVDTTGKLDTTFACKGDAKTLLPKYISLQFAEDQAGYLAGIVAAAESKTGVIGAIGGTTLCQPCNRYINGYIEGAQAQNPSVKVKVAYVTHDFSNAAFNDPVGGKNFAQSFISTNKPDVLFQVAGKTGNGVLDAACAAKIYGIGVDVDQYLSYPNADPCIITSAEKHLQSAVESAIKGIAAGTAVGGDNRFDATNDGIGISPITNVTLASDVQTKINDALAAMKAGTLNTCPNSTCNNVAKSTP